MRKFSVVQTAVLMCFILIAVPISMMASEDPFLDAGFIQARKKAPALDFTLEDLNGDQVRLIDFRGKVVMLFFWTTW